MKQPAYEKVKDHVLRNIRSGRWTAGDSVPTEAALMALFGVSRMTVNRAMRELAVDGLVVRRQGLGTFVADLHPISSAIQIRDIHEEIAARKHLHSSAVLAHGAVLADARVARCLGLPRRAQVFHSMLLHRENGEAIQLEERYVNPACAPGYLDIDFTQVTPTRYLLQVAPLTRASFVIEACMPGAQEAAWLEMPATEPCLRMCRTTYNAETAITTSRLLYPASRHHYRGDFRA